MGENTVSGEPFHILLIEDEMDHAELVTRSLAENRVANKIHHVTDGEAALDYLHQRGLFTDVTKHPRPHIILLDLRLPKIDGLEVLKEIKTNEDLRTIPVVVLTTSSAEKDITRAYEFNANSYVVKPVTFSKFQELMNDLGFYWLGWNRLPWTVDAEIK
jgi:CheY-like chemotaxis protein